MAGEGERTALVTGGTDGVGRVVARKLGEAGMHVLAQGRDRERGERVVGEIHAAGGRGEFLAADLASLAAVRGLAGTVHERTDRLHILVSNAGVGTGESRDVRRTSVDGYELRFAVNYLAGFLLTELLLPLLRRSVPARIVNVASAGQQAIDFSNVMLTHDYSGARAYCQSKLAQIMSTIDLAGELRGSGVTVNALHPASYMNTTMVRRPASRHGAASRTARKRSSISPSRPPWKAGAASISTSSAKPAPMRRPTTRRRGDASQRSAASSADLPRRRRQLNARSVGKA